MYALYTRERRGRAQTSMLNDDDLRAQITPADREACIDSAFGGNCTVSEQ